jgi:hypothetical protein
MLFFLLGYIFITVITNAAIVATTTNLGIDSIDINKVGESSKNFLSKIFSSIENWWNGSGSSWVKNIYFKLVEFLNKSVVIK